MAHTNIYCGADVEADEVSLYTRTLAQRLGLVGARTMLWRAEDHMDVNGLPVVPKDAASLAVAWSSLMTGALRVVSTSNYGLVFPFGNPTLTAPNASLLIPSPLAKKIGFGCRLRLSTVPDSNWSVYVDLRDSGGSPQQFGARVSHAVGVNWLLFSTGSTVDTGIAVDTNEHIVFVYADKVKAYIEIDGVPCGSANLPATWTPPGFFQVYSSATGLEKSVNIPWMSVVYEP
jgi:hypothetical protein